MTDRRGAIISEEGGITVEIRRYRSADSQILYDLFYMTVHQINKQDYSAEQLSVWAKSTIDLNKWQQSLSANYTLVAVIEEQQVGFADLSSSGYLDRLYVHHEYQRQGIAQALVTALEQYGENQGLTQITVAASLTAKPFFLKNGYHVVSEQHVQREGISLTNFLMAKQLSVLGQKKKKLRN